MSDNLTREQRRYCMSRVKGKNTKLEQDIFTGLRKKRLRFDRHVGSLPGTPDIVFKEKRIVIFIDSDFWHGYRLPRWKHKLKPFWKKKISDTRLRDRRSTRRLRSNGWKVLRIWEHDIKKDQQDCLERISIALLSAKV